MSCLSAMSHCSDMGTDLSLVQSHPVPLYLHRSLCSLRKNHSHCNFLEYIHFLLSPTLCLLDEPLITLQVLGSPKASVLTKISSFNFKKVITETLYYQIIIKVPSNLNHFVFLLQISVHELSVGWRYTICGQLEHTLVGKDLLVRITDGNEPAFPCVACSEI